MKYETLITMLKEFDYDKNDIDNLCDFLIFVTSNLLLMQESDLRELGSDNND